MFCAYLRESVTTALGYNPIAKGGLVASFVAWVDYSSKERERMREAVQLFQESQTRDELGLGTVRDALADLFFPGTSTVQTRLAYVLLVPWMYRRLEADGGVTSGNAEARARTAELKLIGALEAGGEQQGVIGRRSRDALQRLPSSTYWLTLRRWDLMQQRWSIDDYHRNFDEIRARRRGRLRTDDRGIAPDGVTTWAPEIPDAPADFMEQSSFSLRRENAEFLRDRILHTCKGSLLEHALLVGRTSVQLEADAPWNAFDDLPRELGHVLALAKRFATLMQGAAYAYNLALCALEPTRSDLEAQITEWAAEWSERARQAEVATWDAEPLWTFCREKGVRVGRPTEDFVGAWQELVRTHGPEAAVSTTDAVRLVTQREGQLKGARSRFTNRSARAAWQGPSGTALMTYRWFTARAFLADLFDGLAREED
jgi:hypothetical protein